LPPVAVSRQPTLPVGTARHDRRSRMGGRNALSRASIAVAAIPLPIAPAVAPRVVGTPLPVPVAWSIISPVPLVPGGEEATRDGHEERKNRQGRQNRFH